MGDTDFTKGTNRLQPQNMTVFKISGKRKFRIEWSLGRIAISHLYSDKPVRYVMKKQW